MTTLSRGQGRRETALCLAGLFLVLFLLSGLYPVTGDDWYREALGASLQSPWDLFQVVAGRGAATNSRILGNLLAYSAAPAAAALSGRSHPGPHRPAGPGYRDRRLGGAAAVDSGGAGPAPGHLRPDPRLGRRIF